MNLPIPKRKSELRSDSLNLRRPPLVCESLWHPSKNRSVWLGKIKSRREPIGRRALEWYLKTAFFFLLSLISEFSSRYTRICRHFVNDTRWDTSFSTKRKDERDGRINREWSISTSDRVILTHCPRQAEVAKLNTTAKEKARKAACRLKSRMCTPRQLTSANWRHVSFLSFLLSRQTSWPENHRWIWWIPIETSGFSSTRKQRNDVT